jgi:hypothetical protein
VAAENEAHAYEAEDEKERVGGDIPKIGDAGDRARIGEVVVRGILRNRGEMERDGAATRRRKF